MQSEAAPKLTAYPPLAEPLARGVVIVQYRTENIRIMAVFGDEAADVSPRLGHLHVTVDDSPGTWAHTSGDPIIYEDKTIDQSMEIHGGTTPGIIHSMSM